MKRWHFPLFVIVTLLLAWAATIPAIAAMPTPAAPQPGFFGDSEPVIGGAQQSAGSNQFTGGVGRPAAPADASGPTPTPIVPTLEWDPNAVYQIKEERTISAYTIRVWQNPNSESLLGFDGIVTVQAVGQPMVQIDMAGGVHELTGTDITGEGNPDLVIETYSGGAHC